METETQKKASEEVTPPVKPAWQAAKESWYDHLNITVKQLDIIIGVASGLLILVFILIILQGLHIL